MLMKIQLLCLHRNESYAGEYLPEVVSCVDEVTLDENPQWWVDEKAKARELFKNVGKLAVVEIEVATQDILDAIHKVPTVRVTKFSSGGIE